MSDADLAKLAEAAEYCGFHDLARRAREALNESKRKKKEAKE